MQPNHSNSSSPATVDVAVAFLRSLATAGFWGTLTIKFQHGDVIHVVREESIPGDKIATHLPNNRRTNDTTNYK